MAIPAALLIALGKPVADILLNGLFEKKDGARKLEQAAAAMAQGLSAIEALKQTFGKVLTTLNDKTRRLDSDPPTKPGRKATSS